jgi:hypothetical protein
VSGCDGGVQFTGDGTNAHPPLRNQDVVAFFPFQVDLGRFVIPVYVMTRDLGRIHQPRLGPTDPRRFDMPEERYRLTIVGVDGQRVTVRAREGASAQSVPVVVSSREADRLTVEMPLTDGVRLLELQEP